MPFVIDINPVLVQLGPVAIRWYGLALIAAVAVRVVYPIQLLQCVPTQRLSPRARLGLER